jgi:hypothetical protein
MLDAKRAKPDPILVFLSQLRLKRRLHAMETGASVCFLPEQRKNIEPPLCPNATGMGSSAPFTEAVDFVYLF